MATKGQIVAALNKISPDCSYDAWYRIAAALYNKLGDDGFDIFDEWSSKSQEGKYPGRQRCLYQWGHSKRCSKVTIGTLFYYAKASDEARP